jgi:NAD(P)-dependent dehydrogenase (short-subunit alcohol dehydrogenase family)
MLVSVLDPFYRPSQFHWRRATGLQLHAFGRAAKPEEIAWTAVVLASDKFAYTTGSIITIDGGGSSRRSSL